MVRIAARDFGDIFCWREICLHVQIRLVESAHSEYFGNNAVVLIPALPCFRRLLVVLLPCSLHPDFLTKETDSLLKITFAESIAICVF